MVIDRNLDDAPRVAIKKRTNRKGIRSATSQRLQLIAQSKAGVHDIFHEQDILAFNGLIEILGDSHHSGGTALVGKAGDTEEIDFDRNFNMPSQGSEEED